MKQENEETTTFFANNIFDFSLWGGVLGANAGVALLSLASVTQLAAIGALLVILMTTLLGAAAGGLIGTSLDIGVNI